MTRNLFLGVLGHDLRNPLGAVSMGAQWMERLELTDPKQAKVVSEIKTAAGRATQILNDLLDLTRTSFGTEIPIAKTKTDIATLCQEIADEYMSSTRIDVLRSRMKAILRVRLIPRAWDRCCPT